MTKKLVFILFILSIISCDILRSSPFEITAWTPGVGFHADVGKLVVSVLFSDTPDRPKTEQSFSLSEDNRPLKGNFEWEDNKLIFISSSALEKNRDYRISVDTGAQSVHGVSLDRKCEFLFTTRSPGERPKVVSTSPGYDGVLYTGREPVTISFSGPVTINSCVNNISFTPTVNGAWNLDESGSLASFVPLSPWKTNLRYKLNIQSSFSDINGRTIGEDYSFMFTTNINDDPEKPELVSAWAVTDGSDDEEIFPDDVSAGLIEDFTAWESETKLKLVFSKSVDTGTVRDRLASEPFARLEMETPLGFADSVVFSFAETPVWQSRFILRLNSGICDESGNATESVYSFRIAMEGAMSKPPSLIGMRLPIAPGNEAAEDQEIKTFIPNDPFPDLDIRSGDGRFPYLTETKFWLELYFDTAPEAKIDLFSLMDLFEIDVINRAFTFSSRGVSDSDFTWQEPAAGWESFQRVEIMGFLTNTVNSGIATFRIRSGLRDTMGNQSDHPFEIKLQK